MSLLFAPLNTNITIVKMLIEEKTAKHLEIFGIAVGTKLKVVSQSGGQILVIVNESKIAIDRAIAAKIIIK